jgi:hypothetical protein
MSTDGAELRTRWRALAKVYSAWTLPLDLFLAPSSYRMFGANLLPSIMDGKRARQTSRALEGASPEMLDKLTQLAEINASRTGESFKVVALCYVTLPLALAAFFSDAAPDQMRLVLEAAIEDIFIIIGLLVLGPIVFFISHWRAKQMAWALALHRVGALAS